MSIEIEETSDLLCQCGKPVIVELAFYKEEYDEFLCRECGIKKLQEKELLGNSGFWLNGSEAGELQGLLDAISDYCILEPIFEQLRNRLREFIIEI